MIPFCSREFAGKAPLLDQPVSEMPGSARLLLEQVMVTEAVRCRKNATDS